ncbi:MAG: hypothetical protein PHV28_18120, partial [Kiritimatiellae bacterium]|nr:hypothetical protein [Kiritimatiellia bacterium]
MVCPTGWRVSGCSCQNCSLFAAYRAAHNRRREKTSNAKHSACLHVNLLFLTESYRLTTTSYKDAGILSLWFAQLQVIIHPARSFLLFPAFWVLRPGSLPPTA